MRTITRLRLPLYLFGAVVLGSAATPWVWSLPVGMGIATAILWYVGEVRCPACGGNAAWQKPRGFWRGGPSVNDHCPHCGVDFWTRGD